MLLHTDLASAIDTLARAPNKAVKVVHVSCPFDDEESVPAAPLSLRRSLNAALVPFHKLTSLSLRHAGLCDVPAAVQGLLHLKQLDLSHNRLTSWPVDVKLPTLQRLSLDCNRFGSIPEALGAMSKLSALTMSNNSICDVGTALDGLRWLSELDLSRNEIGPSVSGSLFDSFPCLVVLKLEWNSIYSLPPEAASRACKRISHLSLFGNPVTVKARSLELQSEGPDADSVTHDGSAQVGVTLSEQCARKSRESEQYVVTLLKQRAWAAQKRDLEWPKLVQVYWQLCYPLGRLVCTPNENRRLTAFRLLDPLDAVADEVLSDQLRTGDVLLFARKCVMYQPLGALACQLGKVKSQCEFDHAGVIVMKRGRPFVAEETFSGIKVRPYDERIYLTTAESVVVRRLAEPLTEQQQTLFDSAIQSLENQPSSAPQQLMRCLQGPPVPDPVLTTAFRAIESTATPLGVKDFAGNQQPLTMPLQRETIVRMK